MRDQIDRLLLLLRTVIWLKPVQVYWRIWLRLYRPTPREFQKVGIEPPEAHWVATERAPTMIAPRTFTFLNQTRAIETNACWNDPATPKLWLYNAHYFDDLVARNAIERKEWQAELIEAWIAENPPGVGNGWEPYPTSLRIVNWVKWLLSGNGPTPNMRVSLAAQADWLSRRLEYHLLGNHLFANAKALVFAGCALSGPDAARWRDTGLKLLRREIPEQILPDGGHFERSIMYHAILTEDVLDLVQLGTLFPDRINKGLTTEWSDSARKMVRFLIAMSHSDVRIAFFNDGAFGIAPEPDALIRKAHHLNIPVELELPEISAFRETGYTRLSSGNALLLTDTAKIGPDYLPGHAHADTLSFEFSLGQQRIFVNGGTSVYGGDTRQRFRERSTASHNTLCIDGQNSSEIWSDFRVALRAKPSRVSSGETDGTLWAEGSHDGYRRFKGPLHTRRWELTPNSLAIHDRLDRPCKSAKAYFRVHPDLDVDTNVIRADREISIHATGGTLSLQDGIWSPEFGRTVPCKVLVLTLDDLASSISFTWEP